MTIIESNDKDGKLHKMNAVARQILEIEQESLSEIEIELIKLNAHLLGTDQYSVEVFGEKFNVAGRYFEFYSNAFNHVFIFKDINMIKNNAREFMYSFEKIGVDRLLGRSKSVKKT